MGHLAAAQGGDSGRVVVIDALLLNLGERTALTPFLTEHVEPLDRRLSPEQAAVASYGPLDTAYLQARSRPGKRAWARCRIENPLPAAVRLVLSVEGRFTEEVEAYVLVSGSLRRCTSGDLPSAPFQVSLEVELPAESEAVLLVHVRGRARLAVTPVRNHYLLTQVQSGQEQMVLDAYVSGAVLMMVLVFALSALAGTRAYLLFSAYVLSFTLWILFYSGALTQDLAQLTWINDATTPVLMVQVAIGFGLQFALAILSQGPLSAGAERRFRWAKRVVGASTLIVVTDALLSLELGWAHPLPSWYAVNELPNVVSWLASFAVILPEAWAVSRRGYLPSRFLLLSYALLFIASLFPVLHLVHVIGSRSASVMAIMTGSMLEFVGLALALGARIRLTQEQELAFREANQALLAEQKAELESKVAKRTAELTAMADQLAAQNASLNERNHDFLESLHYAGRIQRALLPTEGVLAKRFSEYFILYEPRDIVSGDFFWIYEHEGDVYVAVADCTGHGVPGAFLSMVSADLLRQIVVERGVLSPSEILIFLDIGVRNALNQEESDVLDGLDISICRFVTASSEMLFAGANHPILLASGRGTLQEVRGTRRTIGEKRRRGQITRPFQTSSFELADFDSVYLFTDGIVDQFGGDTGRKLGRQRLYTFIGEAQHLPMAEQRVRIQRSIAAWRGERKQLDDQMLLGLRVR